MKLMYGVRVEIADCGRKKGIEHRAWSMGKDISHMPAASLGQFFALAALRSVPQAGSQFRFAVICCNR